MGVEELVAAARGTAGEDALAGLAAVAAVRREVEQVEEILVRRARNSGASWAEIAAVLGVSKQAVHKKYAGRGVFGVRG